MLGSVIVFIQFIKKMSLINEFYKNTVISSLKTCDGCIATFFVRPEVHCVFNEYALIHRNAERRASAHHHSRPSFCFINC